MAGRNPGKHLDRLLAVLDLPDGKHALSTLSSLARESDEPAAAALIKHLTYLDLPEDQARSLIESAFRRRETIRSKSGYDLGVRLALFDLITSVEGRIDMPMLIDMATFEAIERSAITDGLTGLFNRAYFESRLQRETRRARRYTQHLSLLLLDLDNFKEVNDTQGHPAGDAVLREMGRLINSCVRDIDIAARYGGEEFTVILPETRRRGAFVVAERIRAEVEKIFRRKKVFGKAIRLTVSGGLSCYPEDAEDPSSLLSKADKALYRAKSSGKNLIDIYFEEKRRDERIPVDDGRVKAILRREGARSSPRQSGRVRNISEGGLLVELTEPVPVGCEMQVSFSLGSEHAYTLRSTVVRVEPGASNGKRRRYEAGLRFQRRAKSLQPELVRLARRDLAAG